MKVLEKLCLHFAMQDLCENARLEIAFEVDYFKWFLLQVNRIKYRTYLGLGTEKEKPLLKKQI